MNDCVLTLFLVSLSGLCGQRCGACCGGHLRARRGCNSRAPDWPLRGWKASPDARPYCPGEWDETQTKKNTYYRGSEKSNLKTESHSNGTIWRKMNNESTRIRTSNLGLSKITQSLTSKIVNPSTLAQNGMNQTISLSIHNIQEKVPHLHWSNNLLTLTWVTGCSCLRFRNPISLILNSTPLHITLPPIVNLQRKKVLWGGWATVSFSIFVITTN